MSKFKGFTRIASSYDLMEIRMAVAALEGADIVTIAPGTELSNTLPHASLALGPMEIHVPDAQAEEARVLLNAVAEGTVIAEDMPGDDAAKSEPLDRPTTMGDRFRNLFGFVLGGVSQPLKGLLVDKRRRDPRD